MLQVCKKVKKSCELIESGTIQVGDFEDGKYVQKEILHRVIKDSSLAEELLPTTSGFFFGSTEYDEFYLADIDLTIEQLKKVIKDSEQAPEGVYYEYYYQASW